MNIRDAKILVLTVDCWSEKTGANTMSSLFSWVRPENLANIYIRADIPTYTGCNRYFQICENDVIKSILKRSRVTGRRVEPNGEQDDKTFAEEKQRYGKYRERRPWLLLYAREILWKMGAWRSKALDDFLEEFKPDLIVFAYEGYIHFNRLVRYCIKKTGAKAAGYFWDDNFTYLQRPHSPGYRIYRFFQRRDLKKSVHLADLHFAIAPKTKREADAFFGIECRLMTKPMPDTEGDVLILPEAGALQMLYTGNLGIGRLGTVKLLAQELAKLNADEKKIVLHIYSGTPVGEEDQKVFGDNVLLHRAVPQGQVATLQQKAHILLFAEDICGKDRFTARLSFSTKLTDYFAARRCIFAIAEADIAPMEYLREHEVAFAACDRRQIAECLQTMSDYRELICEMAERAYALGKKEHCRSKMQEALKTSLQDILK